MLEKPQIFISYSGHDEFEAGLLQFAFEKLLADKNVTAWTYRRDQKRSENEIAKSIKSRIKQSIATVFLVSPSTLKYGATQWMELAYSDAFEVDTFVLLHHLKYQELKENRKGIPPFLLSSQCNSANEWRSVAGDIKKMLKKR